MVLMDVDGPAGAGLDAEGTQMCRGEGVNVPIVGVQGVSVGDVFGGDGEDDTPVGGAQRAESLRSSSTTSSRSRPAGASRTHTTRRSGACRVRGEQSGPIHPCEQGAQGVAGKGHADGDVVDRLPVVLPAHEHHQVLRGRSARSAPATDGRNGSPNPGPRTAPLGVTSDQRRVPSVGSCAERAHRGNVPIRLGPRARESHQPDAP